MTETDDARTGSRTYRDFLRARSRRLTQEATEAGFFAHRPTSGRAREDILKKPLTEVLPSRYGIGSGEVLAHDDSVSSEWDVVIFDRENTPHLYRSVTASKYPIETVLATISVKSHVDGVAVDEVVEAGRQLRAMPLASSPVRGMTRTTAEPYPLVYLYGFRGIALRTIMERVAESVDRHQCAINGVCVHGEGMVLPEDARGPTFSTRGIQRYNYAEGGDGSFGFFVSLLYVGLAGAPMRAPNLPTYMNLARIMGAIPEGD